MKSQHPCRKMAIVQSLIVIVIVSCRTAPTTPEIITVPDPSPGVTYPRIVPVDGAPAIPPLVHEFPFENRRHKLTIPVDADVAAAAKDVQKVVKMMQEIPRVEWAAGLQWALITDPAQTPLYEIILKQLRKIRRSRGLDDDRYAELITLFVQSITYCNAPGQAAKYPIETIADRCGDCDDKSRLLVGLLLKEGYDVALLVFHEENHMAVGIKDLTGGFMGSGYAYIETTSPSYIGFPSYEYSEVELASVPEIIVMAREGKQWRKGAEVTYLYETLNRERKRAEELREKLADSKAKTDTLNAEYQNLSAKLDKAKGEMNAEAYNKLVAKTNRAADKFNRSIDDHNQIVKAVNQSVDIVTRIFDHPDDRHGVYRWVKKQR